jgi:hypothetical protein
MERDVILDAIGDIKQLNTMQKVSNEWVQRFALRALLIDNSEMVDLERFSNSQLEMDKRIGVNDVNDIKPLPLGSNITAQQFLLAETINAIHQQLLDIELPMEQQMIAFETQIRAQKILTLFNATFGRINLEFIEPIVTICLKLMEKNGIIKILGYVGEINQFTTKIALRSPLSKMQQLADIDAIRVAVETVSFVQPPLVAQQINLQRIFRFVWEGAGAPLDILNSEEEIKQQREQALKDQIVAAQARKKNFMK